jgi:tagaturonate epimerase
MPSVPPQAALDAGQPLFSVRAAGADWTLVRSGHERRLVACASGDAAQLLATFEGDRRDGAGGTIVVGPANGRNAAALRAVLPWLGPSAIGLTTSAGFGDRLGLATPGHVRALRAVGGRIAPVFAQQSIREMTRTGRSPQDIIDAATWGAFEAGWTDGFGADADHLKAAPDITACAAAGFTFYTIDPGEHVDGRADAATAAELSAAWDALPWAWFEDDPASLLARYAGALFEAGGSTIAFDTAVVMKAAVKYGRAIAHVTDMYRHIQSVMQGRPFDLEVSVDETDTPTTHAEHVFIVRELLRRGVRWASLAPRFIGRFEKGVDYIGDVKAFHKDFAVHAAIARTLGPYKISLHSGSDKFSIYGAVAEETRGLVHLKTAGTSWVEALRALAGIEPVLFRSIYRFALSRYTEDRASYHVSASLDRAPAPESLTDGQLPALLDQFDARQVLHVTFGSILTAKDEHGASRYGSALRQALAEHPDAYAACLERHFIRHLKPFVSV